MCSNIINNNNLINNLKMYILKIHLLLVLIKLNNIKNYSLSNKQLALILSSLIYLNFPSNPTIKQMISQKYKIIYLRIQWSKIKYRITISKIFKKYSSLLLCYLKIYERVTSIKLMSFLIKSSFLIYSNLLKKMYWVLL